MYVPLHAKAIITNYKIEYKLNIINHVNQETKMNTNKQDECIYMLLGVTN